jgi:Domain of unknown function (DUF4268)
MIRPKKQIRAYLWIAGDRAKGFLALLRRQKEAVERELGYPLEWEELRRDCRISCNLNDVDPEDNSDSPRQHDWMAKRLNDMHRVFSRRVAEFDADSGVDDG